MKEGKIKDILKENITGQKLIKDCVFYTIGKSLKDEDINDIDTIKEFENKLDEKKINCIKLYINEERIVYRQANNKEGEQRIEKGSEEFSKLCLKLFEYSKESLKPNQTNANSSGLPTILIKEYAKRQNDRKPVNYIEAEIDEAPDGGVRPPIYIRNIECNVTGDNAGTTQSIVKQAEVVEKLFKVFNPNNKPFDCYILGTPTHVSSLIIKNNGIFYLFDTTGHTHQMQQRQTQQAQKLQAPVLQVPVSQDLKKQIQQIQVQQLQIRQLQIQQDIKKQITQQIQLQQRLQMQQRQTQQAQKLQAPVLQVPVSQDLEKQIQQPQVQQLQIRQSQEQQNKPLYYTSELVFNKDTSLLNGLNTIVQLESEIKIRPVSLNPFGLDYQNGSSACGIWTSNVLAVASTYESIKDFIIKDEEGYVAMFKSEFMLKVSAKVAEALSVERAEVKILEQKNNNLPEGGYYCKCKVGNTLFAIDTTYNAGSCLNINNILLSLSQKELEFYNDNNINNEIIERREQLIEKIKMDRAKCAKIMDILKMPYATKLEKTNQEVIKQEAVDLNKLKSEIAKLKEEIKLNMNESEEVKSNLTKPKTVKLEDVEVREAETKKLN